VGRELRTFVVGIVVVAVRMVVGDIVVVKRMRVVRGVVLAMLCSYVAKRYLVGEKKFGGCL